MGIYLNLYEDFPNRCQELWKRMEDANKNADRDLSVTTMLMVAMAGFASPWEFLKHSGGYPERKSHPAFDGVSDEELKNASERVSSKIKLEFTKAPLFGAGAIKHWRFGYCTEMKSVRRLAENLWNDKRSNPQDPREKLANQMKTRDVLKILRNALSHGNVCAFVGRANAIDRLVFFSEDRKNDEIIGWHVATASVEGFQAFLTEWFALICEPQIFLVVAAALDDDEELLAA
jgi:hypothetical protein